MRLLMRPFLPAAAILAFGGSWLLHSHDAQRRQAEYRAGAERILQNVSQVQTDLCKANCPTFDSDLYRAQMGIIAWKQSLSGEDSRRASVAELSAAMDAYSSAAGTWDLAFEPRMEGMCAQMLDESAQYQSSGDKHLADARRLLDAGQ
jgi:hypothetical protein